MLDDQHWMQYALKLANTAKQQGEVPVGAVLILDNQVIGEGFNSPISHHDPSAHAEMLALRDGAKNIGNYRLLNTTLYVTLEPCLMCAAAMVHARVKRLVFAAKDEKAGAVGSLVNVLEFSWLNHRIEYQGGVLADQCSELLKQFFRERRA